MPANPSHLQLNRYYLKELTFLLRDTLETPPGRKTDIKTVDLDISDSTVPLDKSARKWRCELTIKSKSREEDNFYDFRIVMIGFFTTKAAMSAETARNLAETNAPAVLYSTSREIIATVTRRSPYPGTLLPTVTFIKDIAEPPKTKK